VKKSCSLEVDVVDNEVTDRRSQAIVDHLDPYPASPFVERNVARDAHVMRTRYVTRSKMQ
jgi:hypothetical protein